MKQENQLNKIGKKSSHTEQIYTAVNLSKSPLRKSVLIFNSNIVDEKQALAYYNSCEGNSLTRLITLWRCFKIYFNDDKENASHSMLPFSPRKGLNGINDDMAIF